MQDDTAVRQKVMRKASSATGEDPRVTENTIHRSSSKSAHFGNRIILCYTEKGEGESAVLFRLMKLRITHGVFVSVECRREDRAGVCEPFGLNTANYSCVSLES